MIDNHQQIQDEAIQWARLMLEFIETLAAQHGIKWAYIVDAQEALVLAEWIKPND